MDTQATSSGAPLAQDTELGTSGRLRVQLEAYCRTEWSTPGLTVSEVTAIPEGHSGFTYFVDLQGAPYSRMVLRLPPPGAKPIGPADVVRQGNIMRSLGQQGLAVPKVPVICDGSSWLDGRPFILMEAVPGARAEVAATQNDEVALASAAIAVMKQIHSVPLELTGIGGETSVGPADELARWQKLISRAPEELTRDSGQLHAKLSAAVPAGRPPTLVHGDFTFGNLLFDGERVSAILDWEIAQIGEPLMDLGSLCVISKRHDFPQDPNPSGSIHASVPWLIERYADASAPVEWFVALSYYKYAAIVGYNTMLHRTGKRPDPIYNLMPETVRGLLSSALDLLG